MFKRITNKTSLQAFLRACFVVLFVVGMTAGALVPAKTAYAVGAVSVVGAAYNNANSGSTTNVVTFSSTGASYILVAVAGYSTSGSNLSVSSVTATGLTFAKLSGGSIPADNQMDSEYWGAYSSTSQSSLDITIAFSTAADSAVDIISLAGVKSSSPVGTTLGPTSTTGDMTAAFTGTTSGSMIFAGAMTDYDWSTVSAGAGTTLVDQVNVAHFIRSTSSISGGSQTISSTGLGGTTFTGFSGVEILADQGSSAAGTPAMLNYQARVTTAGGTPITTATNMRFVIWDAASGGNCVWSGWGTGTNGCTAPNAGAVSITPVSGAFSLALGDTSVSSQNALPTNIFDNDTRYLEIQMYNGSVYETLSPRKRILSSAYAFNANRLNGLASSASGPASATILATDSAGRLTVGGGASITGGAITLTANGASNWSTSSGTLTITSAAAATWGTAVGNLSLQAAGVSTIGNIQIGVGGAGSTTPDFLVLDATSSGFGTGNPTGTNGAMYYNGAANKFRCYQSGAWTDCIGSGGSSSLQTAYAGGATITTSGSTNIAFTLTSGSFTATGAGSVNLTPTGASSFTSGGALTLTGGAASTWSTSSGALTVDSAAALNLGTANATSVVLGKTGITTTNNGALAVTQTFTGSATANYFGTGTLSFITPAPLNMMNSAAGVMKTQLNLVNTGGGSGAGSAIDFYTYDVSGGTDPGLRVAGIDNSYSADFAISTKTPGAPGNPLVEKFRITNTGNVGIGVTGPTNKLSIGMTAPPTTDIVSISNSGQASATAGVSGLQITYVGGAAAVEASAERIDLTGGTTAGAGAIWNGLRLTQGTITPGTTVGDIKFETAALTQTTAVTTNISGIYMASGTVGSLVQNTAAGTINWTGVDIITPNITQTTGTILSEGIAVTTGTITTGGTTNGIDIIGQGAAAGTLNGIKIGNITASGGTESAINIGTGWDNGILFAGAGTVNTAAASALTLTAGTTGTLTLDTGTTGAINIGTNANAKTVTVGNTTGATRLNINAGTGGIYLTGAKAAASGQYVLCINSSSKLIYIGSAYNSCNTSSARFKHDIKDIGLGLDVIEKMHPVSYVYNDTNISNLGFIAEEAAQIDDRLVTRDENGLVQGIDMFGFVPIITRGVQELAVQVQDQKISLGPLALKGEDLSTLVMDIQAEAPQDAVATINGKIAIGERFLTNLSAARVTAVRGYFDETFAAKTHQEKLCLGDAANGETCVTKEQLDAMLAGKAALAASGANTAATATTNTMSTATPAPTDDRVNQVGNITSLASLPVMSDLSMSGFSIDNVLGLNGVNGNWSLDEHGLLTVTIKTDGVASSLYAMTGANAEVVLSGSSRLEAGHGHIAFTKEQKDAMAVGVPYRVNVTMTDSANGVYVSGKNADGFNVVETMGGTSGATFDWLVIARRVGYENANDFGLTPDQLAPLATTNNQPNSNPLPTETAAAPVVTNPPPSSDTAPVVTAPPATDTAPTNATVPADPSAPPPAATPSDTASINVPATDSNVTAPPVAPSTTPVAVTPPAEATVTAPPADTASTATPIAATATTETLNANN